MEVFDGADGSNPVEPAPIGTRIIAGYVGEPGQAEPPDTPHIWPREQWNDNLAAAPGARCLPIYTHNYPGDPRECAENGIEAILALGWRPGIGRLLAVDLETLVDHDYEAELEAAIADRGFEMLPYQPVWAAQAAGWMGKVWAPILTRHRPTALSGQLAGIQWRWGRNWDDNVFGRYVFDRCGRGLRG